MMARMTLSQLGIRVGFWHRANRSDVEARFGYQVGAEPP